MDESRTILIVANRTSGGAHLEHVVRERIAEGPVSFVLLVPATRPEGGALWTEGQARAIANRRGNAAARRLEGLGAEVKPLIGGPLASDAIEDVLHHERVDEIIISTLPAGVSHWIGQDLPARVARRFEIPVTHIEARPWVEEETEAARRAI